MGEKKGIKAPHRERRVEGGALRKATPPLALPPPLGDGGHGGGRGFLASCVPPLGRSGCEGVPSAPPVSSGRCPPQIPPPSPPQIK